MTNKKPKHVLDKKGEFVAYLYIYGKNKKLLTVVFEDYITDKRTLNFKQLEDIKTRLLDIACIKRSYIDHVVLDIKQDVYCGEV